ncbi:hypothetical protein O181_089261 [Austropuccinia psidii MF-1]|uniref:Uncharacterized protein n=1 Tax=Austropuccinia psidii MF-1 TaxID=1389203 RepID=A0A9Q3P7N3_9BASI|nr:hypothetical protein [Austropuccinia psidii MF-1]
MDHRWPIFQPMASGNHQSPQTQLSPSSPQIKGKAVLSSMYAILQYPGVVHIWYYIPLCTIFVPQSIGAIFRMQFCDSISRSQNPTPILKEESSAHQSGNPWQLPEDHSRTPSTWPCSSWVGNSFRIISRAILRVYYPFQSVFEASSTSIILGQLHWSIQVAINQPVCPWPN